MDYGTHGALKLSQKKAETDEIYSEPATVLGSPAIECVCINTLAMILFDRGYMDNIFSIPRFDTIYITGIVSKIALYLHNNVSQTLLCKNDIQNNDKLFFEIKK